MQANSYSVVSGDIFVRGSDEEDTILNDLGFKALRSPFIDDNIRPYEVYFFN